MAAESPQVELLNQMILDYADNPELREIFAHREVGERVKLKFELQIINKFPEGTTLAVEKVIVEAPKEGDKTTEVEPDSDHPMMATMQKRNRKNRGMKGPHAVEGAAHGRPPQTATNSQEPWQTAYA